MDSILDADDELIGKIVCDRIAHAEEFHLQVLLGSFKLDKRQGEGMQLLNKIEPSNLISERIGITSSNLYLKSTLCSIGGWDEYLTSSQEADLLFRCFLNNAKIGTFNQSCCIIHTNGDSRISNNSAKSRLKNFSEVRYRFFRSCPEKSLQMEIALYRSILNFQAPFFARLQRLLISFLKIRRLK